MTQASILLATALAIICLFLPRRFVVFPFIVAACLVPMNQRVYICGLDFTVLRILVFTGMLRAFFRKETLPIKWHSFDQLVLAWNLSSLFFYTIQYGTFAAFINRCGVLYDSLGMYWLFRHFFRSFDDILQAIKVFAFCAVLSVPFVGAEKYNQASPFAIFGPTGAAFHRGRFRCAGPFPHYIMLGCFWASLLPFFYGSLKVGFSNLLNIAAIFGVLILVYFSASSTPLITIGAIIGVWMVYTRRYRWKSYLLFFCLVLFGLHLIMEKPVWHLMARANIFGGSTGWHRYHLFDQFIKHVSDWVVCGTQKTADWGNGLQDVTNQYVLEAVRGGIVTLIFFVAMLYQAVRISCEASLILDQHPYTWIAWAVCVSLIGHMVSFWGASYFGQILMLFYMTLAMVGFLGEAPFEGIVFTKDEE